VTDFVNRSIDQKGHLHKAMLEIPSRSLIWFFLWFGWAGFYLFIDTPTSLGPTAIIFDAELETLPHISTIFYVAAACIFYVRVAPETLKL